MDIYSESAGGENRRINPEKSSHDQYVKALALALMIRLCKYISMMHYKSNSLVHHCVCVCPGIKGSDIIEIKQGI